MQWFKLPGGKAHILQGDDDEARFPIGRAQCAPFARHRGDEVLNTNEIASKDMCRFCVTLLGKKH